jgi:hypothetical protein
MIFNVSYIKKGYDTSVRFFYLPVITKIQFFIYVPPQIFNLSHKVSTSQFPILYGLIKLAVSAHFNFEQYPIFRFYRIVFPF